MEKAMHPFSSLTFDDMSIKNAKTTRIIESLFIIFAIKIVLQAYCVLKKSIGTRLDTLGKNSDLLIFNICIQLNSAITIHFTAS